MRATARTAMAETRRALRAAAHERPYSGPPQCPLCSSLDVELAEVVGGRRIFACRAQRLLDGESWRRCRARFAEAS